ncbi:MAG: polysaccharide deacetylase family protein [Bacteroidota bacterium]
MILLFTPKINNRLQYIAKTILHTICGFDYKVTNSGEEFLNFKGARINYSDKEMPGQAMKINPHGFLFEKGVRDFVPETGTYGEYPVLFPKSDPQASCDLGFDIFSSSFYQLSRYEEYLPYLEDRHGRFEADQSLAYQKGFLELPLVDIHASILSSKLLEMFPFLEPQRRRFTFQPTYDIDTAYAHKGKGLARNTLLFARDVLTLDFSKLSQRLRVITNQEKDPFDTYDYQLHLQKKYKLNPVYFFLCAHFGPKDRNISIHSRTFQSLVKTIGDYARAGIHPSYASNFKEHKLPEETSFLSGLLHRPIQYSRQHFLKINLPKTYQQLLKINIRNDFSMGYASHTGFRAGTCTPFSFYDLSLETETRLKIYPLTLMDGTLKDYMKLKPSEALQRAKKLADRVKQVNGTFITLWHNDTLSETNDQWKGWRNVYEEIIKYTTELMEPKAVN